MELSSGKPGKKKGQRRRTLLEIARDRREMVRLRLRKRLTLNEIAIEINKYYADEADVDPETGKSKPEIKWQTVKRELKKAVKEFQDEEETEVQLKRREVSRQFLDLMALAHEEYEKSKTDKIVKTSQESTKEGAVSTLEKEVIEVRSTGNPSFLRLAYDCVFAHAEMEAVIPPKKIAPTNPEGTLPYEFDGGEEFRRLRAIAAELMGQKLEQIKENKGKVWDVEAKALTD